MNDIEINLVLNTGQSLQNINTLTSGVRQVGNESKSAGNAIAGAFKQSDSAIVGVNRNISQNVSVFKQQRVEVNQVADAARRYVSELSKKIPNSAQEQTKGFTTLRQQIRLAQNELARMAATYGDQSVQANAAAKEVARLRDIQEDLNERSKAFDPDRKLTVVTQLAGTVAGAFSAAQAALSLFGSKSEETEKIVLRLQQTMSFAIGLNALSGLGDSFKNLKSILGITTTTMNANTAATEVNTVVSGQNVGANAAQSAAVATSSRALAAKTIALNIATVATRVFSLAISALTAPLTLIFGAIAGIVLMVKAFSSEGENFSDTMDRMSASGEAFANSLEKMKARADNSKARIQAYINELEANSAKTLALLKANGATEEEIAKEKEVLDKNVLRAKNEFIKKQQEFLDRELGMNKKRLIQVENDVKEYNRIISEEGIKSDEGKRAAEEKKKAEAEIKTLELKNDALLAEDDVFQSAMTLNQIQAETERLNNLASANEKRLQKQKELNTKYLEAQKSFTSALSELDKKLQTARASGASGEDRASVDLAIGLAELEQLKKNLIEKGQAEEKALAEKQGRREKAFELSVTQQEQFNALELLLLDKHQKDLEAARLERDTVLLDLIQDEETKRLLAFEYSLQKRVDALKKAGADEIQIEKFKDAEINNFKRGVLSDKLAIDEELSIALIEGRERGKESELRFEAQKQVDILNIQLEYARKRLEVEKALLEAGDMSTERQLSVAKLESLINGIKSDIGTATAKLNSEKGKISFARILGIVNEDGKALTQQEEDDINEQIESLAVNITSIYQTMLNEQRRQNDEAINMNREYISSLDERIRSTEDALRRETEAQLKGYASNVDGKKQELALLDAERKKALERERQLTEEKKKLQRQQAVIDGLQQASSLITAGAAVFANEGTKGLPGIIMAIGAIAAMVASFLALKASIRSATSSSYEEGGLVGGARHSSGGNKFLSEDGRERVEIERDEFIVNRKSTAKHLRLVKAINDNDFGNLSFSDVSPILEGVGIKAGTEKRIARMSVKYSDSGSVSFGAKSSTVEKMLSDIHSELSTFRKYVEEKETETVLSDGSISKEVRRSGVITKTIIRKTG